MLFSLSVSPTRRVLRARRSPRCCPRISPLSCTLSGPMYRPTCCIFWGRFSRHVDLGALPHHSGEDPSQLRPPRRAGRKCTPNITMFTFAFSSTVIIALPSAAVEVAVPQVRYPVGLRLPGVGRCSIIIGSVASSIGATSCSFSSFLPQSGRICP